MSKNRVFRRGKNLSWTRLTGEKKKLLTGLTRLSGFPEFKEKIFDRIHRIKKRKNFGQSLS
jgi:hypothetical protein